MKKLPLIFALLFASVLTVQASELVTTRPVGTDSVNWSSLGPQGTVLNQNLFNFTTTNGVAGTGTEGYLILEEGSTWAGNFAPGDYLNWNPGALLTLNFSSGYSQIGAQVDVGVDGPFSVVLCDINNCVSENGVATDDQDNSAIYIGIQSPTPISFVSFLLESGNGGIAINEVTLGDAPPPTTPTPEPSSLLLLGSGVVGFAGAMRRKLTRN